MDDVPFEGSFMALGDGTHKLAIKAALRKRLGKGAGDTVRIHLTERRGVTGPFPHRFVSACARGRAR